MKTLLLFLLCLCARLVAAELTQAEFVAAMVAKELEAYAQTAEVKTARAKLFMAQQGGDATEAARLSQQLEAMKTAASAQATLKANQQWAMVMQARQAPQPVASRADLEAFHARHQQATNDQAARDYQTWLLEQQLAVEVLKLQRRNADK